MNSPAANPLRRLAEIGQSVWFDNLHRAMLEEGELARLVRQDGLAGVTSNPTIFEKAMVGSERYDQAMVRCLARAPELDAEGLFFELALVDIREAADVLRPVFDAGGGRDGMVSLEVSPALADDTEGTVAQARELARRLERPNVMIKVPATAAGIPVIETLIAEGINVNVTLLFDTGRYAEVVRAYLAGLRRRLQAGEPLDHVASVASFFVSRVDTAVDALLEDSGAAPQLRGTAAVANAAVAYRHFLEVFDGPEFADLKAAGAQEQRLLWASTGTKNPAYSDVLYVESLAAPRTVTTLPPATYEAFRDHGRAEEALGAATERAPGVLAGLGSAGVDLAAVTARLEAEGVDAFVQSYRNLLQALERKVSTLPRGRQAAG